jgi:hypothetical protein
MIRRVRPSPLVPLAALTALATFALAGCESSTAPSPSQPTFNYDLTRSTSLDVEARTASGAALAGVLVSVRAPAASADQAGELLWMGSTASDGHARATLRTEHAGETLDVTLHKPGWRGPWSDEALRVSQAEVAPSARFNVPTSQAGNVHVQLERSE